MEVKKKVFVFFEGGGELKKMNSAKQKPLIYFAPKKKMVLFLQSGVLLSKALLCMTSQSGPGPVSMMILVGLPVKR